MVTQVSISFFFISGFVLSEQVFISSFCIFVFVIAVLDSVTWPGQAWWHLMLKGVCISLRERYDVTISPKVHSHHDQIQIQIQIHNSTNTKSQQKCKYNCIDNSCDPGKLPNLVPKGIMISFWMFCCKCFELGICTLSYLHACNWIFVF